MYCMNTLHRDMEILYHADRRLRITITTIMLLALDTMLINIICYIFSLGVIHLYYYR